MRNITRLGLAALIVAAPAIAKAEVDGGSGNAGPVPADRPTASPKPASKFDALWKVPVLYSDKNADGLNELRVTGRLHLDNYIVDPGNNTRHDLVVRRARLGARAKLFKKLDIQAEADLDLEGGQFYNRITDAFVRWNFSDAAKLTVGKHGAPFTLDGATSSNELITIDRSNESNNLWFTNEYSPGVSLSGKSGKWTYHLGAYSGGAADRDFGKFSGKAFYLASVGHDFASGLGTKKALLRLDYVNNPPDAKSTFTRPFHDIGSVSAVIDDGNWGVSAGATLAKGSFTQKDVFGTTLTPWVKLNDHVQLVARYTYLDSKGRNGVRLARYENVTTTGRGDRYNEIYGGLNYFIYGHKLKLQTGLAYAKMRDRANDGGAYDGVNWTTALRFSF